METTTKLTATELENHLSDFHGSETLRKHYFGLLFTEGIESLAEEAGAYWLIDLVCSYRTQKEYKANVAFQLWSLNLDGNGGCVITMRSDSDTPELIRQVVEYTDFPMNIEFYCCSNVMMLKSEY